MGMQEDMVRDYALFSKIDKEINQFTNDTFAECTKYSDIVFKLEWPDEKEKQAIENSKSDAEKTIPLLLYGVVVDNRLVEGSDIRRLELVDISCFDGDNTNDSEKLHFLQMTKHSQYVLFAYKFRNNFDYSIGPLERIRPGTKVILSLVDLSLAQNNPKQWMTAHFTDIAVDDAPDLLYIDQEYRLHKSKDYLALYQKIRDKQTSVSNTSKDGANNGCYIATSVYGSYDCPEVWTLRRFRDQVLAKTRSGRLFIRIYYAVSPTLVKWFGNTGWFQNFWRKKLDSMVLHLQSKGIKSNRYDDMH